MLCVGSCSLGGHLREAVTSPLEDLGADYDKGLSIKEFKLIYTDPSFEDDAEADYRRVFGTALR